MSKIIVLHSGGADSLACLIKAVYEKGKENVVSVGFNYNQRHKVELEYAERQCEVLGVQRKVFDIGFLGQIGGSQLTDMSTEVTTDMAEQIKTVVPLRNMIMLTITAAYAQVEGFSEIWTGPNKEDYSAYRDCRREFYDAVENAVQAGLTQPQIGSEDFNLTKTALGLGPNRGEYLDIKIVTPYVKKWKFEIIKEISEILSEDEFHTLFALSHTCYEGKRPACGKCPSCLERLNSFAQANLIDPLKYA